MKTEGRKVLRSANLALVILSVFLAISALGAFKTWRTPDLAANTISVTGRGEAITLPDISTFSFTVSKDAKTVTEAQDSVTTMTDNILRELKDLGIEEKDIKTTDYSIYPRYSYVQSACTSGACSPSRQVADGYTVNHTITVKVRKTADAGKALSAVGGKGATNVSGLTFTMDDPNKAMNDARAAAIDDAKDKAEVLAKHLGVHLVRVVGYFDNGSNPPPIYAEGMMGGAVAKSMDAGAPTLPTGENKTTAEVTVNYEIR